MQVAGSFSKGSALRAFARAQPGYYNVIGRMQLLRLAADAHMTARAYVLLALKDRGLEAKDDNLRKARTK